MKRILVLAVVAAACAWALYALAYRPLSCNWKLDALRSRTNGASQTVRDYQIAVLARQNLTDLRRCEDACGTNVLLYMLEAENENLLGNKEAAIALLRKGLTVDQRPELHMNIGALLLELGRMDEAVDEYVIAVRFTPQNLEMISDPEVARRVQERLQQIKARPK